MSILNRRRAVLVASALGCALFCASVAPLAAAPLTFATGSHGPREIAMSPSLYSSLVVGLLVLGGLASAVAASRRPQLHPQRVDSTATVLHIVPTAPPNAGFGWGVGN